MVAAVLLLSLSLPSSLSLLFLLLLLLVRGTASCQYRLQLAEAAAGGFWGVSICLYLVVDVVLPLPTSICYIVESRSKQLKPTKQYRLVPRAICLSPLEVIESRLSLCES